jgi:hypothetical protein
LEAHVVISRLAYECENRISLLYGHIWVSKERFLKRTGTIIFNIWVIWKRISFSPFT